MASKLSSLALHSLLVLALAALLNLASNSLNLKTYFDTSSFSAKPTHNMTVKLYGSPSSTCTRRVATVLKEKNVPYELIPIDLGKGEHKKPEFTSLQPFGQVPVLKDGDFTIYESRAIGRYIALKYGNQGTPGLIPSPSDFEAWGRFEEAASIEQNNFDPFASGISGEKIFKLMRGGTTDEKRVKELTDTLYAKLEAYEVILSKRKYLAGDTITLADLFHLPYGTMITERLGIDALNSKPNVARWWKDITSRPSWQAVKDGA
ncbi:glutathione S-transferase [Sanghuangporus baumii]|uniref:glutathione transferase n=1 Tax=Sanghuangporus baumii TaxID=108892 RepID=A0A9Q5N1B2_SANBA|nr:glutathione S-transferase [Sanghuangporus baumii]